MIKLFALLDGDVDSLAAAASKTPIDPLVEVDGARIWQLLVDVISPKVLRKLSLSSSNDRLLLLLIRANGLPGTRRGDLGAEDNLKGDLGAEERAKEIGCDWTKKLELYAEEVVTVAEGGCWRCSYSCFFNGEFSCSKKSEVNPLFVFDRFMEDGDVSRFSIEQL